MPRKSGKETWEQVGSIDSGKAALRWCRRVAHASRISTGVMADPGPGFSAALLALSRDQRRQTSVYLTYSKNHYQHQADFIGVIGLPAFLGIFALFEFSDVVEVFALIFIALVLLYILLYAYYRLLAAVATTATESFQLVVVELEKD